MKILNHYSELEGKEIAFSHMAQFAEHITLATKDGSVLMATFDITDHDEQEIRVLSPGHVLMVLNSEKGKWIREELGKLGIFDIETYRKEEAERLEQKRAAYALEKERKDLEELARLQAKYGVE